MLKIKKYWLGVLLTSLFSAFPLCGQAAREDAAWQYGVPEYEEAKVNITHDGPTLLFSDSPEMVKQCGIMYRDTVSGSVRLFFHHVNDMDEPRKLSVVLRRASRRPSQVTIGKHGVSRANEDWLEAGKEAQHRYYASVANRSKITVVSSKDLLNDGKGMVIRPQELITGIVDLTIDKPVEVSVLMMPVEADSKISAHLYPILPPDEGAHVLRGTFEKADCHVTLAEPFNADKGSIWGITLADDGKNPYVRGKDVTTGKAVVNYGNYGVMYDVNFKTQGRRNTILRLNPYGGPFAGVGVLEVENRPAKHIQLPNKELSFGWEHDGETMKLGTIPAGKSGTFHFSPPGSSNLPVRLFWQGEKGSGRFRKIVNANKTNGK